MTLLYTASLYFPQYIIKEGVLMMGDLDVRLGYDQQLVETEDSYLFHIL